MIPELLILLTIGLIAGLVIWLVSRNLDKAGESPLFGWLGMHFVPSVDRGNWWLTDRRLAKIPEMTALDRRERRQIYLDACKSWKGDHGRLYWGTALGAGVLMAMAQPWAERLGDRLATLSSSWPVIGRVPAGFFEFMCAFVIYVAIFAGLFSLLERGVLGRLLELARRRGASPIS